MAERNDRIIVKTITRNDWVVVEWAASNAHTGGDEASTLASIDIDIDGNMYLRFHNDADDPFILVLDSKGLRIYESEDLPPNMDERHGDLVVFDAEQHQSGQVTITAPAVLRNAYSLLGDGTGGEWDGNPEYTRGIVELVGHLLGMGGSDDRDAILARIRQAGALT